MTQRDTQELRRKASELLTMYQREGVGSPEAALRAAADLQRMYGHLGERDAFDLVWSATRFKPESQAKGM